MSWDWLRGHQEQVEMFRSAVANGRLASTFLFIGPPGIGKRSFAIELAKCFFCETNPDEKLESCGHCPACVQVAADSHPDLMVVAKPDDKAFLPIELFVGDRDHRMQAGLCHDISLKPHSGSRKVAIIDDADFFNQESANCLLKTLEEPPPGSILILIGTSEQKQLPTIRSRSQVIRFQGLSENDIEELLLAESPELPKEVAADAARQAEGSLERARQLCDEETRQFRADLVTSLSDPRVDTAELGRLITGFVEGAGTEAAAKRGRMRLVAGFAASFYRDLLLSGAFQTTADAEVESAKTWWAGEEITIRCLDHCVEAESQIAANANPANWIESLVDHLTRAALLSGKLA